MDIEKLTDEELIERIKHDKDKTRDQSFEVLWNRYRGKVGSEIKNRYFSGFDEKDMHQEGSIVLWKAVWRYNGDVPFKNFFSACLKNRVKSIIKSCNSKKNTPLNKSIPFDGLGEGDQDKSDIVADSNLGPEESYINIEAKNEIENLIKNALSDLEYKIISLRALELSYTTISKVTGKNEKSIDNALHRARKKVSAILQRN